MVLPSEKRRLQDDPGSSEYSKLQQEEAYETFPLRSSLTQERDNPRLESRRRTPRYLGFVTAWALAATLLSIYLAFSRVPYPRPQNPWAFVPDVPWKAVTFNMQEEYYNFSTAESMEAWEHLQHIGNQGWVIMNEPQDYPWLPKGIPMSRGREKNPYSAFHGLHCLAIIQKAYTARATQNDTLLARVEEDHVEHCFDYIQQKMKCSADMTMEGPSFDADGNLVELDGWGITHMCRDWDWLLRFVLTTPGHDLDLRTAYQPLLL